MKTPKNKVKKMNLSESLGDVSNHLLFHPHPILENLWMDSPTTCNLLGVSERSLWTYKRRGYLTCIKEKGRNLYPVLEVEELLNYLKLKRA